MCIEKTCAEEFLAYTDKRVFLSKPQAARVKCYSWNVWIFFYSEKITPSKPKWSVQVNEQTRTNCRAFMSQSPTIFNFLPAGDHIPLRELAEGIARPHFCCCRRALLWRWDPSSLPCVPGCSCSTGRGTDTSSLPAHPAAGEATSAKTETHSWGNSCRSHQHSPAETFPVCWKGFSARSGYIFFAMYFTLGIILTCKASEITKLISKNWTANKRNYF